MIWLASVKFGSALGRMYADPNYQEGESEIAAA